MELTHRESAAQHCIILTGAAQVAGPISIPRGGHVGVVGAQSRLTLADGKDGNVYATDGNFYQANERNERQL